MAFATKALYGRANDELKTRRVEHFIDYMNEFFLHASCYRISDVDLQKAGIDLIMNNPDAKPGKLETMLVDEKFAVSYMHKELQTYSFELSSDNNKDNQGWFLSPEVKTTHYELVWPRSTNDGQTIDSATVALVSKNAIQNWLAEKGVDPQKLLEQMKSHYHGDNSVTHYPECTYDTGTDYHGNLNRLRMKVNGVTVVQSLNGKENPINILIPKSELCRIADKCHEFTGPIHAEDAKRAVESAKARTYSIDDYMSAKDWARFEEYRRLPNNLTLIRDGHPIKGKKAEYLCDGDRLCVQTPYGRNVCLAVYGERKQLWGITGTASKILGPDKCFSIPERIKDSFKVGGVPFGFTVADETFSKQLYLKDLAEPKHGDSIITFGENTQNQVVHLRYNAYAKVFVLNENKYVNPETLPAFRGIKVISERENDLKRAMTDRLVNCIPDIRKKKTLDLETLTKQIENVVSNRNVLSSTHMLRSSAEEIELRALTGPGLTEQQKADSKMVYSCFPDPKNSVAVQQFARSLARDLVMLNKEERCQPDRLSALLYNESRMEIARQEQARDYDAKSGRALNLEDEARKLGFPTFSKVRGGPALVTWNDKTIQQMISHLNQTCDKSKNIILTGAVPAWAMAAIANEVQGNVYIRNNIYSTVRCEAAPMANITYSQGLTFDVKKENGTATITWTIDPNTKITAENMKHLQVPMIDDCQNIVLQSTGAAPAFITASLCKSYQDVAQNIVCARAGREDGVGFHGGTCVLSQDKSNIGKHINICDIEQSFEAHKTHTQYKVPHGYDMRSAQIQRAEARRENSQKCSRANTEPELLRV